MRPACVRLAALGCAVATLQLLG
eukprot:COSAG04_NODE_24408_length_322_cov_0.932735_1_plen_22_part_10